MVRSEYNYIMTKDVCVPKEAKDTQEINSGSSSNDTMASSDFSTPQFHAINDGSSVISNSIILCFKIISESYNRLHFIVYKSFVLFCIYK